MLGGAWSQVPAIKKAKELGFYVITCDYLPDNPGHKFSDQFQNISTVEKEKIFQFAREQQIQGIIAYASDPSAITSAYVSDKLKLPGSSLNSVRLLSEKDLFRQFQKDNGFKVPSFFSIKSCGELDKIKENLKYPCMVKPVDSSGSKGVIQISDYRELESAVKYAIKYSRCGRVIIEEYIFSPYFQLHGDGIVVDGELKFIALGDQRFLNSVPIGSSLPSQISKSILEKVNLEVARLIKCSGFQFGGINVEVRVAEHDEIYILEIGPRTGGNYVPQLMRLATGEDVMTSALQISMGIPCKIKMPDKVNYCFQYIIGSRKSGRFQKLYIDEYMKKKISELYIHKQSGEWINSYKDSAGVVGVALIRFNSMEEMEADIRDITQHIQVITEEEI